MSRFSATRTPAVAAAAGAPEPAAPAPQASPLGRRGFALGSDLLSTLFGGGAAVANPSAAAAPREAAAGGEGAALAAARYPRVSTSRPYNPFAGGPGLRQAPLEVCVCV